MFLDVDDDAFKDNLDEINLIYLLDYQDKDNLEYSTGLYKSIDKENYIIEQSNLTKLSSSGCPIMNSMNLKVIGIQAIDENRGKNIGIYIKEPIYKFKEKINIQEEMIKIKNLKENKGIKLKSKEFNEKSTIINDRYEEKRHSSHYNKEIIKQSYDNTIIIKYRSKDTDKISIFGKIFVNNNKGKCKLIVDGLEKELS